ncbi:MAG: hypothetical protein LQ337_003996 [Flavoplaca oasis]|nr:MAG: hypothetical protein LQ337_003996 [Flavoplaca oasis]
MVSILDDTQGAPTGPTTNGKEKESSATGTQTPSKAPKIPNGNKDIPAKPGAQKDEKISGAELKKRAKAEKAAKRAQSKQEQPAPPKDATKNTKSEIRSQRDTISPSPHQVPPKGQHSRTGSASATSQKPLQLRPGQQQAPTAEHEPRKGIQKLAFVSHLYGIPRRTSIAGAGKDVHPSILALGLQMGNYLICGSNARCVSTLLVFKRVIDAYTTPPNNSLPRDLTLHLSAQIDYLKSCRPLSISMGNAIRWLKLAISTIDPDLPEYQAKTKLNSAIDNFIRERITVAGQVIASSASSRIQDGDVILTFAKSSIVERTLAEAHRQGKSFQVRVVDSGPLSEGRNLAIALANLGLRVQYASIHTLSHTVQGVTKVFLGAHAMMSNGRLYSRLGTALVAMTAKDLDLPVMILCEGIKFTDKVSLDSIATNEMAPPHELGFCGTDVSKPGDEDDWRNASNLMGLNLMYDLTPAEYIHMVITEYGNLPPSSVPVVQRLSTNT